MNNHHRELSQHDFERIESYLLNRMTEVEKIAFEKELAADDLLRNETEAQQVATRAVEAGELKNRLDNIHDRMNITDSATPLNKRHWIGIAAGIAAILASAYLWFYEKPNEDLFEKYATVDPGLPTPMSATANYNFYDAMVDFKNEKYQKAIDKWSPLLIEDPKNDTLNYYVGAAHFAMENYSAAILYFKNVHEISSSEFVGKSEWYLALSWLQTEDFEKIHQLAAEAEGEYAGKIKAVSSELKD